MSVELAIATKTAYDGGTLTAQVNLLGDGASCAPGEAYHPFGFQGRPKDPDVDPITGDVINGARALYWYEGSTLHTLLLDDPRRSQALPEVDKGGAMMYADADGAFVRYAADGTLEIRCPDGKPITVQVGVAGPKIVLTETTIAIGELAPLPLATAAGTIAALAAIALWIATWQTAMIANHPADPVTVGMTPVSATLATAIGTTAVAAVPTKIITGE